MRLSQLVASLHGKSSILKFISLFNKKSSKLPWIIWWLYFIADTKLNLNSNHNSMSVSFSDTECSSSSRALKFNVFLLVDYLGFAADISRLQKDKNSSLGPGVGTAAWWDKQRPKTAPLFLVGVNWAFKFAVVYTCTLRCGRPHRHGRQLLWCACVFH